MEEKGTRTNGYSRMDRRSHTHCYSWPGTYHITIQTNKQLKQPLGVIAGDINKENGSPNAPYVALTDIGQMVEHELTTSITAHYPMIEVQDHIVMPEHLHAIVVVHKGIVSAAGKETHLGQVIAGFKKGCNRRYWAIEEQRGKPAGTRTEAAAIPPQECTAVHPQECAAVHPQQCYAVHPHEKKRVPSNGSTGRTPLFEYGYVDVMPVDEQQLKQQRQYIRNNPRSRLLRTLNRSWLQPQRQTIPTALTPSALRGYLQRECHPTQFTQETWAQLYERLLIVNNQVVCDSYGNRHLLAQRLLPVVCHRRDASLFPQQKERCLAAAQAGAVLVSARIAKGEQAIINEAEERSLPVIIVEDNGFPQRYHPSERRIQQCAESRLLLVSPWHYCYRPRQESISVVTCKAMNCIVQSLCRTKDTWWKV